MVTTDHSPCPPEMKMPEIGSFDQAWGGIASLGLALPVMWTALQQRGKGVEEAAARVAKWMAAEPSRLAGLTGRKGALTPGADADFVVVDADTAWTIKTSDLHFRHKLSPYLGAALRGRVLETWLRGSCVFNSDGFAETARGRELVRA
jgi:allantoinase